MRSKRPLPASGEPIIRSQFGVLFNWVVDHDLQGSKGVEQLKVDALRDLKAGRPKLIDFLKKHRSSLRDQLDFCWELVGAGRMLERLSKSRVEILFEAATDASGACSNGDASCARIYDGLLEYQGVSRTAFLHSLFETLLHGRRKGNAFMVVGGKDTGKTTLTDPARLIFKAMMTPQADSFCPLQECTRPRSLLVAGLPILPGASAREGARPAD